MQEDITNGTIDNTDSNNTRNKTDQCEGKVAKQSKKRKQKQEIIKNIDPSNPPKPPKEWDRCHFYIERKGRFCRQVVKEYIGTVHNANEKQASGNEELAEYSPRYCGNHYHLYRAKTSNSDDTIDNNLSSTDPSSGNKTTFNQTRRRIPCPLDPSHTIYEHMLHKHLKICPKAKLQHQIENQPYFVENINKGGFGLYDYCSAHSINSSSQENQYKSEEEEQQQQQKAERLALAVLQVYHALFPNTTQTSPSTLGETKPSNNSNPVNNVKELTVNDLYNAIPLIDLSESEIRAGLHESIASYKIKAGGLRHVQQQASIIGHLRRRDLIQDTTHVLEMGAGRGMLGLFVAGAIASSSSLQNSQNDNDKDNETNQKVHFVMVERGASRFKAEARIRQAKKELLENAPRSPTSSYLKLEDVDFQRIRCDLAHVDLPVAVPNLMKSPPSSSPEEMKSSKQQRKKTIVVAKHLCGCGTDLALKSLLPISSELDGCAFATCCHGICNWDDYVGRSYLQDLFAQHYPTLFVNPNISAEEDADSSESNSLNSNRNVFGRQEFDIMRKWTAGCVHTEQSNDGGEENDDDDSSDKTIPKQKRSRPSDEDEEDEKSNNGDKDQQHEYSKNISKVVDSLELSCGIKGLGRACQRIFDHGRKMYMKHQLHFTNTEMVYYVDENVTPQNSLLLAMQK